MIAFSVKSNVKGFTKYLNRVQRKQVPFATARALTWTVKEAQNKLIKAMPSTFNVTKKWWLAKQPTGIRIKPASKVNLIATVYTNAYFLPLQEDGGIKIPLKGRGILIPTERTPKYGRKAGGSRKVMAGKKIVRRGGTSGGSPIATMQSGKRGVFRRRGKKRLPIDLLYSYVATARIKPRMRFKSRAYRVARRSFDTNFGKSLSMAVQR